MRYATAEIAAGTESNDRIGVFDHGSECIFVVADGAGRGVAAAEAVIRRVAGLPALPKNADDVLRALDRELAPFGVETTAVVLSVSAGHLWGASVGDSGAWLVDVDVELTRHQHRKPLLGSGSAQPTRFSHRREGRLLLATDGLLNYLDLGRMKELMSCAKPENAAEALLQAVRLPNGNLHDDVSLIVADLAVSTIAHGRHAGGDSYEAAEPPLPQEPESQCPENNEDSSLRILFVENHPVFAATVIEAFLPQHTVHVVPSVREAASAVSSQEYDVALVDYDLDDGKGEEVVRLLRQNAAAIRILGVSARPEGNVALLQAGADETCSKMDFARIGELLAKSHHSEEPAN